MLKEIYEQPAVSQRCLDLYFPVTFHPSPFFSDLNQIHILACGTSFHGGLVAQYWFEQLAGVPTIVRSASEFQVSPLPTIPGTLTIAVTQSGETTDTIAALKLAQSRQMTSSRLLAITNQDDSAIAKIADRTMITPAGSEIGVAATKTFLAQLMAFCRLALEIAYLRQRLDHSQLERSLTSLRQLPHQIEAALQQNSAIAHVANTIQQADSVIVLGSGINSAIALEGALKLKETTYLHAEGYAAGEFLHGSIALLDAKIPVIAIAPLGEASAIVVKTVQKAKATGSPVIGITPDSQIDLWDRRLLIPNLEEWLSPMLTVIPLQLLAYHIAISRKLDVDRPRNITKSLRDLG